MSDCRHGVPMHQDCDECRPPAICPTDDERMQAAIDAAVKAAQKQAALDLLAAEGQHADAIDAAVKAERERCAGIADGDAETFKMAYLSDKDLPYPNKCHFKGREVEARQIAAAIRAEEVK